MKFLKFLNEKITKKEFDDVLDNSNIKAGCEFEFYMETEGSGEDWSKMKELIDKSDKELGNRERDLSNYWDEYRNEERKVENAKNEADDIEEIIDELRDKQLDLDEDDEKYQEYYNTLQRSIDKRQKTLDELLEIIEYWDDGTTEQDLLNQYDPIPTFENLNYLEDILYELSELSELGLISVNNKFIENLNQWLWEQAMENEEIPNTNQILNEIADISVYDIEMMCHDIGGNIPDADEIYNDYDFPTRDVMNSGWEVKEDGSLGENGMEISTGIYQLSELIDIIEEVFEWIDDNGETDSSCGFHVHLSISGKAEVDALKLLLFSEEGKVYKEFEERIGNTYALAISVGHFSTIDPFTKENLMKLAKKEKLNKKLNLDKYMGVHLIDLDNNHVEFRYMGGKNYHRKFKEIREIIVNYGFWLSIASDPNFKRKEYLQKAARLNNKYSYIYYFNVVNYYHEYTDELKRKIKGNPKYKNIDKVSMKILRPYLEKLKPLPKPGQGFYLLKLEKAARNVATELYQKLEKHYDFSDEDIPASIKPKNKRKIKL